jgi:uncharacterized protein (TIGR03067 family)
MLSSLLIFVLTTAAALATSSATGVGLVGEWALESKVIRGDVEPVRRGGFVHVYLPDGRCLSASGKDTPTFHFNYTIDTSVRPMRIDMTSKPPGTVKPVLGIFKIEGDTLTICQATTPDGERPTTFKSTKDPPRWLYVYKRIKKKD